MWYLSESNLDVPIILTPRINEKDGELSIELDLNGQTLNPSTDLPQRAQKVLEELKINQKASYEFLPRVMLSRTSFSYTDGQFMDLNSKFNHF